MTDKQDMFDERYRKVLKRHRQLSRGYATRLGANGIIEHFPLREHRASLPLRMAFVPLLFFFAFKAVIVAMLGQESYVAQVALMREGGSAGEEFGAFLMQIDPITQVMVQLVTSFTG